jgi:hypothetical protein
LRWKFIFDITWHCVQSELKKLKQRVEEAVTLAGVTSQRTVRLGLYWFVVLAMKPEISLLFDIVVTYTCAHDDLNHWTHFEIDDDISKNLVWKNAKKPTSRYPTPRQHIMAMFGRRSEKH